MHAFLPARPAVLLAAALAVGASLAAAADAATISQTFDFSPQTLISGATSDTFTTTTISASFDKFDPSQGVLTGASFAYDYRFNITATLGANGGTVGGAANGPFEINGEIRGGSGNGGSGSGSPNVMVVIPFPVTGTQAVDAADRPGLVATGPGQSNTFDYDVGAVIRFDPQMSATASYNLTGASSVTVTYTFTAVPEPAGLAVAAFAGTALLRRRRHA